MKTETNSRHKIYDFFSAIKKVICCPPRLMFSDKSLSQVYQMKIYYLIKDLKFCKKIIKFINLYAIFTGNKILLIDAVSAKQMKKLISCEQL